MSNFSKYRLPWYGWLLAPFVLPAALFVLLILAPFALLSIPYFLLFPERHRQVHDFDGSDHQRQRIAQWRAGYSRLSLLGRLQRAFKKRQRRSHATDLTSRCS